MNLVTSQGNLKDEVWNFEKEKRNIIQWWRKWMIKKALGDILSWEPIVTALYKYQINCETLLKIVKIFVNFTSFKGASNTWLPKRQADYLPGNFSINECLLETSFQWLRNLNLAKEWHVRCQKGKGRAWKNWLFKNAWFSLNRTNSKINYKFWMKYLRIITDSLWIIFSIF